MNTYYISYIYIHTHTHTHTERLTVSLSNHIDSSDSRLAFGNCMALDFNARCFAAKSGKTAQISCISAE